MTRLSAFVAAILLVSAMVAIPAQAQNRIVRPHYKAPPQPRVFKHEERRREARRRNSRARTKVVRPQTHRPRFYDARAAERVSQRLRGRTKARANRSPRHTGTTPRFYNTRSAVRNAKRMRQQARRQYVRPRHAKKRRINPTFWK